MPPGWKQIPESPPMIVERAQRDRNPSEVVEREPVDSRLRGDLEVNGLLYVCTDHDFQVGDPRFVPLIHTIPLRCVRRQ